MDKAWDFSDLVKRIVKAGVPIAEEGALQVINAALDWVQESVTLSDNKIDDMALMAIPMVRKYAKQVGDKIAAKATADDPKVETSVEQPPVIPSIPQA